MSQKAQIVLALLALTVAAAPRTARCATGTDKSQYNLLEPTPRALMRDLSTDRPDVTESAYTVDAGHFQIEMSLVEYAHDEAGGEELDEFAIAPSNLKVGLLNNVDLQLVFDPYIHQRFRNGDTTTNDGIGNTQVRMKLNLWGNDGGDSALAIMPFVQFPTADDDLGATDHVEGGIIVPLSISLPQDWTIAMMGEIDFVRDEADDGYGTSLVHTLSLSRPIVGELGGYVEYVGIANHDVGLGYLGLVGGGLTYGLTPDVQLDAAIYFGISDEADDFSAGVGISLRI
jgi:hypothetical protein